MSRGFERWSIKRKLKAKDAKSGNAFGIHCLIFVNRKLENGEFGYFVS
jgi:hypothetical protein